MLQLKDCLKQLWMQMHKDDEEAKGIAGADAMECEWVVKKEVKIMIETT